MKVALRKTFTVVWFECVPQNSCTGNLIPHTAVLNDGAGSEWIMGPLSGQASVRTARGSYSQKNRQLINGYHADESPSPSLSLHIINCLREKLGLKLPFFP